ncbi:hypothetical protein SAMN02745174_02014 [Cetobacterium ceti]|uniref:Thioredoxin n=1 Tax=Cetobacterium ceti TaxID=180163 RepID=A0A1T4PRT2_9FUSO|nr:thioredoxin family protein [Cetobacterium ceti]SJZ94344.1 hypothetical protein SAMN02745174_02014 [Cetobacterium ceti]
MLSRLESFSKKFENSIFVSVDVLKNPEVSGEFLVFSTPVLLLFYKGREVLKQVRFFSGKEIKVTLDRLNEIDN